MKFGVMMGLGVGEGCAYPEYLAPAVARAEETGFESVWAGEHMVMPDYVPRYPYTEDGRLPQPHETDVADPLVWLSYAAALTSTIRLATGVVVLPLRNPVVLAKQIASLDLLSGGRAMLGIGVGWMREEADVVGVPFDGRGRRAEEYVAAMRALWSQGVAAYDGETVRFTGARCFPKPVQKDRRVPVVIGGSGKAAARRAGRIGDGYYPVAPSLEALAGQLSLMRASARDAGRDPDEIEVSTMAFSLAGADPITRAQLDDFHRMEELGVSRIVVPRLLDSRVEVVMGALDRLGDELVRAY